MTNFAEVAVGGSLQRGKWVCVAVVALSGCSSSGDPQRGASTDSGVQVDGDGSAGQDASNASGQGNEDASTSGDHTQDAGNNGGTTGGTGGSAGDRDAGSNGGSNGLDADSGTDGGTGDGGIPDGDGGDPCDTNNGGCDALVTCAWDGSTVTCGNCPTGYDDTNGNGTQCADFNACDGTQVCTADYPCQDLPAPSLGYTCRGQFADWTPSDSPSTFTVNDHGAEDTVTDSRSGLEWQRVVDANVYTWANAKTYCSDLIYAGFNDWRLPTRAELESIVDFGVASPSIDAVTFPNTPGAAFWSSSPYLGISGYAWYVYFDLGFSATAAPTATGNARCVRGDEPAIASTGNGGAPPGRYTDNSDGTVSDALTGLTWQQAVADHLTGCAGNNPCTQAAAVAYCSALSLGGNTDWRLPAVSELLTLVAPTLYPAIDPTVFPNTSWTKFWSASAYAGTAGFGWYVNFSNGYSYGDSAGSAHAVRCVR